MKTRVKKEKTANLTNKVRKRKTAIANETTNIAELRNAVNTTQSQSLNKTNIINEPTNDIILPGFPNSPFLIDRIDFHEDINSLSVDVAFNGKLTLEENGLTAEVNNDKTLFNQQLSEFILHSIKDIIKREQNERVDREKREQDERERSEHDENDIKGE